MKFITGLWEFCKNFVRKLYDNTVGTLNTVSRDSVKRMVLWVSLGVVTVFLPHVVILLAILRSLVVYDCIGMVANTFFDLSKLYEAKLATA